MNYDFYAISPESKRRRNASILWARDVLGNKDRYLIVDTETTGLGDDDVVVHFAAMDLDRNMLVDSLVKPTRKRRVSSGVKEMHGIGLRELKDAPIFEKVLATFAPLSQGKKLLCYRAIFHSRIISQTIMADGIARLDVSLKDFECIQERYERFYNRDYLAMPGRDNTGKGDCNAALDVIEEMAAAELSEVAPEQEPVKPQIGRPLTPEERQFWAYVIMASGVVALLAQVFLLGIPLVLYGAYFLRSKKR